MKKLNLSLIDKDHVLRSRLKEAAKESVRDFFPGKDPPEEAVEYVVAAFCLGESAEEFNTRLKLLFEKDCLSVVERLTHFVETHPEFTTASETETPQKETPKPRRQKIVWDASLDKQAAESSGEERRKKPSTRKKEASAREATPKSAVLPETESWKRRSSHSSKEKSVVEDGGIDRWQPDGPNIEAEPAGLTEEVMHDSKSSRSNQLKVPRSRLFQSALGSIKQQTKDKDDSEPVGRERGAEGHKGAKADSTRKNGHFEDEHVHHRAHRPTSERAFVQQQQQPIQQEESILDRIRKPDGSAFEEWEFKRDPLSRGRKRQAEESYAEPDTIEKPADISEVESLKLKIARLEKKVQSVQAPSVPMTYYPVSTPVGPPPQDFDRKSVCVKNVHFLANAEVVAAHFHSCSPIVDIQFAKDVYGRPKGFCFIQFAYEQCVARALELDQSLLLGRKISVVRKLTRPPAPSPVKAPANAEWKGGPQWSAPCVKPAVNKEEWMSHSSPATATMQPETDIKDFAIDTGSQELL